MAEQAVLSKPEYGQHLIFAGTTGCGKSVLALALLQCFDSYFAIDTQDSLDLPKSHKITSPLNLDIKLKMFKKIRYVPKDEYKNKDTWNHVFRVLAKSSSKKRPHPRIVYIDEIFHIGYGTNFPQQLPTFATTARQKKLSLWISAQRPSMIPIPTMSECTRFYVFYLSYEEDIKKIAKFSRKRGLLEDLMNVDYDNSFIEVDRIKGTWRKMPKLTMERRA